MDKRLPYVIGSGTVVAAAAAVLSCYFSRKRSGGDSRPERADSEVLSMKEFGSEPATPVARTTSISESLVSGLASGIITDPDGTVTLSTKDNPIVHAEEITLSQLKKFLKGTPGQQTIYTVAEELYNLERGGALIVVYDCKGGKNPEATMPVKSLAGGKLRDVMRHYARTFFVDDSEGPKVNANFRAILNAFSVVDHDGPSADKWTKPLLERMAKDLGESWDTAGSLRQLQNEPADGAFAILSLRGTVVGASSRIDIKSHQVIELKRQDGKGTGTKHTAAVCAVEWCRLKNLPGAAVVRSDTGRVTFVGIDTTGKKQTKAYEIVGP